MSFRSPQGRPLRPKRSVPFAIRAIRTIASLALIALVPLVLSCASSSTLAKRSETAYGARDYDKAYRQAVASLEKDPNNGRARMALSAAASAMLEQRRQRVINLTTVDTVEAAFAALELDQLRAQAIRYGATVPTNAEYDAKAARIRYAAAVRKDRLGRQALDQGRPKQAWREFTAARHFEPELKGLDLRIGKAWDLALTRVAVMPFHDATGTRGLGREVSEHVHDQLARRVGGDNFSFTQVIPLDRVQEARRTTGSGRLSRAEAIALGRKVGAREVVWGRITSLNSDTDTHYYGGSIWRKVVEKTDAGDKERWDEVPFHAVRRTRTATLGWSWDVIDVASGEVLAGDQTEIQAEASAVYSLQLPGGKSDEYDLLPPHIKASDAPRRTKAEAEWKATFRNWTVPKLIDEGRRHKDRKRYGEESRDVFISYDREFPVWFDDLPSSGELARIALDDAWQPVLGALKQLDPED